MSSLSANDLKSIYIRASLGVKVVDLQTGDVYEIESEEESDCGYISLVRPSDDETNEEDDEESE